MVGWEACDETISKWPGLQSNTCVRTELGQHIGNIIPIDNAVAVPVQNLESIPQRADLGGLQLG